MFKVKYVPVCKFLFNRVDLFSFDWACMYMHGITDSNQSFWGWCDILHLYK